MHGLSAGVVMNAPINIFPFETLHKSEVVSLIAKNLWNFAKDNIWYCWGDAEKTEDGYKPCGTCNKCIEWKQAVQVANLSVFKQQEGTFKKKQPKQEWIDE